ncbi:MAG TPA: CHAT domain-containing protein [Thermoanaerobaculia bacterium]
MVALARGDLAQAESFFRKSLSLKAKQAPESLSVTTTLDNLGGLAKLRGDLDSAEEYFRRSLRLRLRKSPRDQYVARSLGLLGDLAAERGDLARAERYLRASLSLYEQFALEEQTVGLSLAYLGDVSLERGDLAAAESCYRRSLAIRKKLVPNKVGESLYNLGRLAVQRGDLRAAESYLRDALARDGKYPLRTWPRALLLQTLADVLRRTGRLREASRISDLSIAALEAQVGRLGGSAETQGWFRGQNGAVYRNALRLEIELGHPRTAFYQLERFRAQAFLALLAERDLTFAAGLSPELDRERRRLIASYDRNELRLAELDPVGDAKPIEALRREQVELRRGRDEIAAQIRQDATLQNVRTLDFDQVRAALDPGTVMLSWSIGEETSHLFIVAPGRGLRVETLAVGRYTLEEEAGRFRQLIVDAPTATSLGAEGLDWFGRRLYRQLVEPAERWIAPSDHVVLVPDGPLHLLPFAALIREDGRYLVEWKPLSTVLSGTVYAELKKRRRRPGAAADLTSSQQWVAFGDPWFPPRLARRRPGDIGDKALRSFATRSPLLWQRLPESRREVEAIAALFPADRRVTYLDRAATEERAKVIGKDARIVHFATHGFVDDRSPFDSGLVLSIPERLGGGRDNGLLQVWEIFESVRLDADLVVLSACDTGSGEVRGGEGVIGLTRAFQVAGARSVLASLWRVEDLATSELMQRFYRHLRAGQRKDEALRKAQLELIRHPLRIPDGHGGSAEENAAAPYFWAALQLVGDGR